ncbi:MAG: Fic family protein [Deltaproteobacteria bacterium]|jgi:Fic family protein|nr:Fic family protein [Deltaproteobacteria bacterium]
MSSVWEQLEARRGRLRELRLGTDPALRAVKNHFRVPFVWGSNALDGISLSLSETKKILEDGMSVGRKPVREILAAVGLSKCFERMFLLREADRVTEDDVLEYHRLIADSFENPMEAGLYRRAPAAPDGNDHPPPENVAWLVKELLKKCDLARFTTHPARLGALFHQGLMEILPFGEGNGRVARVVMSTVFLQHGFPPLVLDPSQARGYKYGLSVHGRNSEFFENFIADGLVKGLEDFLKAADEGKMEG